MVVHTRLEGVNKADPCTLATERTDHLTSTTFFANHIDVAQLAHEIIFQASSRRS